MCATSETHYERKCAWRGSIPSAGTRLLSGHAWGMASSSKKGGIPDSMQSVLAVAAAVVVPFAAVVAFFAFFAFFAGVR